MASKPLTRTDYLHPTTGVLRSGPATRGESRVDQTLYYQPLESIHGSSLHEWGVAAGLRVSATVNQTGLLVAPGVAVDSEGRHISLAENGSAEIGPDAENPMAPPVPQPTVTATGVTLPGTSVLPGKRALPHFLAIRYRETFDQASWSGGSDPVTQRLHTPWLKLHEVATFKDDGRWIVLARVTLDAGGNVTGLTHHGRRSTALPVEVVRLRRPATGGTAASPTVSDIAGGELRARPAGGLELSVPGTTDQVLVDRRTATLLTAGAALPAASLQVVSTAGFTGAGRVSIGDQVVVYTGTTPTAFTGCSGGAGTFGEGAEVVQRSPFSRMEIQADRIAAVRADGREAVVIETDVGNIVAGGPGVWGDVFVKDATGQFAITLDGHDGMVVAGAKNNAGEVLVKDDAARTAIALNGAGATAVVGTTGNAGEIEVRDTTARAAIALNGATATASVGTTENAGEVQVRDGAAGATIGLEGAGGDIVFKGKLRDPANSHTGIGHDLLRHVESLTDGSLVPPSVHRHGIGLVGRQGVETTRIGVITGFLSVMGLRFYQGAAAVNFSPLGVTSVGGMGFGSGGAAGYSGTFADAPHAVVMPERLGLSTWGGARYECYVSVISNSGITIRWEIDGDGGVSSFRFLVIGPI